MIYLDYQATTPVDPRVVESVVSAMTDGFGNASSTNHIWGERAANTVNQAAREIAALVGGRPADVCFTSGATEALNLAIRGHLTTLPPDRRLIAVSPTEHLAALETCEQLAREGLARLRYLRVDGDGVVDLSDLESACDLGAAIVVVMAANNEIGTIAPIAEVADICERYGALYICDGTQAAGKMRIDVVEMGIPLFAFSAHKLYGPQGVGALIVRRGTPLAPMLTGGGQQRGLRPGTFNLPGIAGFGEACRLRRLEMEADELAIGRLRDDFERRVLEALPEAHVNGAIGRRVAGNSHLSVPGVPNDAVIAHLRDRIAISTGAACSSGVEAPSHVLRAIGLSDDAMSGAFRFGFGKPTTMADVEQAADVFLQAVSAVKARLALT